MMNATKNGQAPTENEQVVLLKDANQNLLKAYFGKVVELQQSGKEFPIDLDEVWQLAYSRRDVAIKELKKAFIEGEDYQLHQKVEKLKINSLGVKPKTNYFLSVSCMEYFIAKKVKPVFEVYRNFFHRSFNQDAKQLNDNHGYQEGVIFTTSNMNKFVFNTQNHAPQRGFSFRKSCLAWY